MQFYAVKAGLSGIFCRHDKSVLNIPDIGQTRFNGRYASLGMVAVFVRNPNGCSVRGFNCRWGKGCPSAMKDLMGHASGVPELQKNKPAVLVNPFCNLFPAVNLLRGMDAGGDARVTCQPLSVRDLYISRQTAGIVFNALGNLRWSMLKISQKDSCSALF